MAQMQTQSAGGGASADGARLASAVNLALHHLKQGNEDKAGRYAERMDALLADPATAPEAVLDPLVLQGLFILGRNEALAKALAASPDQRRASAEMQYIYGEVLYRMGRVDEAKAMWAMVPADREEYRFVQVRLRQMEQYPDAVLGRERPEADQPEVHVLILTKDREYYLEKTLRCLAATTYSNYKVFILDNGSTDGTPQVLERARDILPGTVEVVTQSLPTNIGRPGGHNWLITNWDHSSADYLSILDDDLLHFSPDWLGKFVDTFDVAPNLAAVGGKTVGNDRLIQDATSLIMPPQEDGSVNFFTNRGSFDWGHFDYLSNVTDYIIGCASLFRREVFDEVGLFDIRFSPSQGVDIDHGLRMRQHGYDLMYNGNSTFVHAQLTSEGLQKDRPRLGNSKGNFLKLGYKYSPQEYLEIINNRIEREQAFKNACGVFG